VGAVSRVRRADFQSGIRCTLRDNTVAIELRYFQVTKSFLAKPGQLKPDWLLIDAEGQIVGRLAVKLATILMGKHKPTYTPHVDSGDYIVVINAEKVRFGGRRMAHPTHPHFTSKMVSKEYDHFTGYPGGRKIIPAAEMLDRKPEEILRLAVRRMLPKNKLGRHMLKKLKLYRGTQHPHQSQVPQPKAV
jgi:large subunit ribosomal protein L13